MSKTYLNTLFILLLVLQQCFSGPAFMACELACSEMCFPLNAIPGPGLAAFLACMTPCTALCLGSCFSENTKIATLAINHEVVMKDIKEIKSGDLIQTFNSNNKQIIWTPVLRNVLSQGTFEFISITLRDEQSENTYELEVTPDHAVVAFNPSTNQLHAISARNISPSHLFLNEDHNLMKILQIKSIFKDQKFTLETKEGSVLANGIYVSTICSEVIDSQIPFQDLISTWKSKHNFTIKSTN